MKQGLPPLKVRPASATEARQYLAEPSFSSCTVPVVFYQHNSFNFAHTLRGESMRMPPCTVHLAGTLPCCMHSRYSQHPHALYLGISYLLVPIHNAQRLPAESSLRHTQIHSHPPIIMLPCADNAARFYSALKETAWEQHAKVVLMTGGGLPISAMNLALWQPLSNMSVDSMADFSVRLPDKQARRRRCCCLCCKPACCCSILP